MVREYGGYAYGKIFFSWPDVKKLLDRILMWGDSVKYHVSRFAGL